MSRNLGGHHNWSHSAVRDNCTGEGVVHNLAKLTAQGFRIRRVVKILPKILPTLIVLEVQKNQAARAEAMSGLWRSPPGGGNQIFLVLAKAHFRAVAMRVVSGRERLPTIKTNDRRLLYIDDGVVFCPVVVGCAPTVFVIRRTSTRRLSARPAAVLLDSTGLSLPNPTI
jgi:hypothetical protein